MANRTIVRTRRLVLATLGMLIIGTAAVQGAPVLGRHVIAGGAVQGTGPGLICHATVGQTLIGLGTGTGLRVLQGYWSFNGSYLVGVDPGHEPAPDARLELSISRAFPNPSRGAVRFALVLPTAARVRMSVYDVAGRLAGAVFDQSFEAGVHDLIWNAPTTAAGVFFARLSVGDRMIGERRFVVVR